MFRRSPMNCSTPLSQPHRPVAGKRRPRKRGPGPRNASARREAPRHREVELVCEKDDSGRAPQAVARSQELARLHLLLSRRSPSHRADEDPLDGLQHQPRPTRSHPGSHRHSGGSRRPASLACYVGAPGKRHLDGSDIPRLGCGINARMSLGIHPSSLIWGSDPDMPQGAGTCRMSGSDPSSF